MLKISKAARGELVFAGSLLLLGFLVLWDTSRMDIPQGNTTISPKFFPTIVAIFVLLVGIGLIVEILRGNLAVPEGTQAGDPVLPPDIKTMLIVSAAIGLHVILLDKAGYILAATASFWGIAFAFGARRWVRDIAIALIFATVAYFGFTRGLNLRLPTGSFFQSIGGK